MAQKVKNRLAVQETWIWVLGGEDPLERRMATPSSILSWRIPWTEEPGRLHDWVIKCLCVCAHTHKHTRKVKFSKVCQKAITVSSETNLIRYSGKGFLVYVFFSLSFYYVFKFWQPGHLNKSSKPFEKQPYVLLSSRMFSANFRWMVGK